MWWFRNNLSSTDIGIDLGTANTLIHVKGKGIVLCEPSVVALHKGSNSMLAVGNEAKRMLGRTPSDIVAIKPLKDGVIASFEATEMMLQYFLNKARPKRLLRPKIVIGVPSEITEVEKRAVREAVEAAGARKVYLIEEPMAAAIGANIPVHEPAGNMILDIGGGTTEVAIISLGGMVVSKTIRVAGEEMDEAIVAYLKQVYHLLIGERTAEDIKIKLGSVFPDNENPTNNLQKVEVKGRDIRTGLPRNLRLHVDEIREALQGPVSQIVKLVKDALEITPPELVSDIIDRGIVMVGGGALLRNLDRLIARETGLPVIVADDPFRCVVKGAAKYLDELKYIEKNKRQWQTSRNLGMW